VENRFDTTCFDRAVFADRVDSDNFLAVEVGPLPSWARGSLDEYLSGRIEDKLSEVDAMGRSGSVPRELSKLLEDQLYRARLVGFDGIALDVGSLEAVAPCGVLRSDDSRSLCGWLELAKMGLLHLCLPEQTQQLLGFDEPEPLAHWFAEVIDEQVLEATSMADELEQTPESADSRVSEPADEVDERDEAADEADEQDEAADEADEQDEPCPEEAVSAVAPVLDVITPHARRAVDPPTRQISLFVEGGDGTDTTTVVSDEVSHAQRLRDWSTALDDARGATSFGALEDLFVTAYSPLESALCDDAGHAPQRESLSRWADGFEHCYRDAFERLRTSRQRPRMVFDAPKLAFQLGRACDASGFELVLIDAFRFDVGQRVHDKLRLQLSGQAECVERGVLWSPLPSTTAAGLELLARGADGLRDLRAELEEAQVVSIKEARRLRKLRAGPHSLFKLDAVQVLLESGRTWDGRGLDQLAAEVSVSAARFIRQQPRGTLVFLFGDHGFRLDDGGHGGASPSEVLVPFQAWHVVGRARDVAAE
jgi:hypothetical protein